MKALLSHATNRLRAPKVSDRADAKDAGNGGAHSSREYRFGALHLRAYAAVTEQGEDRFRKQEVRLHANRKEADVYSAYFPADEYSAEFVNVTVAADERDEDGRLRGQDEVNVFLNVEQARALHSALTAALAKADEDNEDVVPF